MRIKDNLMLREIAGSWIVVPVGEMVVEFNGLINLSETGAFLWRKLADSAEINDLVSDLMNEYDIDQGTSQADVREFIEKLVEKGLLIQ
jgi:hypothetical protein